MTIEEAYRKLDDAVNEYIKACTDENPSRAISGWQMSIETILLKPNENPQYPLAEGQHYVYGPQTTLTHALGLARFSAGVYEGYMMNQVFSGEGE